MAMTAQEKIDAKREKEYKRSIKECIVLRRVMLYLTFVNYLFFTFCLP